MDILIITYMRLINSEGKNNMTRFELLLLAENFTLIGDFLGLLGSLEGEFTLEILGEILVVQGQAFLVDAVKQDSRQLNFIGATLESIGYALVALDKLEELEDINI